MTSFDQYEFFPSLNTPSLQCMSLIPLNESAEVQYIHEVEQVYRGIEIPQNSYDINGAKRPLAQVDILIQNTIAELMFAHGVMSDNDEGTNCDKLRAINYYKRAADLNYAPAMSRLACLYENRLDYEQAIQWYQQAVILGDVFAKHRLATLLIKHRDSDADKNRAITLLQEASSSGCIRAMTKLGITHIVGIGGVKNVPLGIQLCMRAKSFGDPVALSTLAFLYERGEGVPKSRRTAFELHSLASECNCAESLNALGQWYEIGNWVKQDTNLALLYFQKAALLGNRDAMYRLAMAFEGEINLSGDERTSTCMLNIMRIAARLGNPWAIAKLADDLIKENTPEKIAQAIVMYKQASDNFKKMTLSPSRYNFKDLMRQSILLVQKICDLGDQSSALLVSNAYETGEYVNNDVKLAFTYCERSANAGHVEGQRNLARMYEMGIGTVASKTMAQNWYETAAKNGNVDAMAWLSQNFNDETQTLYIHKQKFQWGKLAAEQGHVISAYNLARMYEEGVGVEKDDEQAIAWFRKAAENAYLPAMFPLAVMLEERSTPTEKDFTEALHWYLKCVEMGNNDAMYIVARMYEEGRGVAQDMSIAIDWYRKAAELGDVDSAERLSYIYQSGEGVRKNTALAERILSKAAKIELQSRIPGTYASLSLTTMQ
jgi:TPR repeat protein